MKNEIRELKIDTFVNLSFNRKEWDRLKKIVEETFDSHEIISVDIYKDLVEIEGKG